MLFRFLVPFSAFKCSVYFFFTNVCDKGKPEHCNNNEWIPTNIVMLISKKNVMQLSSPGVSNSMTSTGDHVFRGRVGGGIDEKIN